MPMMTDPFAALMQIADDVDACWQRVEQCAAKQHPIESFISLRLGQHPCLIPVAHVESITLVPQLIALPRTQPWVCGAAKIGGELSAIIDLAFFLGLGRVKLSDALSHRRTRIVLIAHQTHKLGLLVDQLLGLRHVRSTRSVPSQSDHALEPQFCSGYCQDEGEDWSILNIAALCADKSFKKLTY